jgi:hypothetical protein
MLSADLLIVKDIELSAWHMRSYRMRSRNPGHTSISRHLPEHNAHAQKIFPLKKVRFYAYFASYTILFKQSITHQPALGPRGGLWPVLLMCNP